MTEVRNQVKTAFAEGLQEDRKDDMNDIVDYICENVREPHKLRIYLPVARRVCETLPERMESKIFASELLDNLVISEEANKDDGPRLVVENNDVFVASEIRESIDQYVKEHNETDVEAVLLATIATVFHNHLVEKYFESSSNQ